MTKLLLGALVAGLTMVSTAAVADTKDVEAGPIWNQSDAEVKCPATCSPGNVKWNGQWKTTVPGSMSVCGSAKAGDVKAGPIWNDTDAQTKCPQTFSQDKWNGQWRTTVEGKMSVCGCDIGTVQ
jgi:hypothetical protein